MASIALDFDIAVEALRAANPLIEPRMLQVGQPVMIPPPGTAAITPPLLQAGAPACYPGVTGGLVCLGLVHNADARPVEDVRVRVSTYDWDGQLLAEATSSAERVLIPAGEAAPYSARIAADPDSFAAARAAIATGDFARRTDERFVALVIEAETITSDPTGYRVTVTLYNPTTAAEAPRLFLVLLDAAGQVAGYRTVEASIGLGPGERQSFTVTARPLADAVPLDHRLYIEARRAVTR
jgi:hypothetical protein